MEVAAVIRYSVLDTPLGAMPCVRDDVGITLLLLPRGRNAMRPAPEWLRDDAAFADVRGQLGEYFAGERTEFDLPLHLVGSTFQRSVWAALLEIPFGETTSYGAIANRLGQPGAARAVGLANGQNPVPIIVPCHRVIGADGSLTGYGGGLDTKRWLIAHEAARTGLFALDS
jgi:methylated-DNA-[protein]-cysteine S-methyltransferase